jgi:hypothetical protein
MFKSTHFAITLMAILFVTIVVSAKAAYVVTLWMDPNFNNIYKYNLWLPQIKWKDWWKVRIYVIHYLWHQLMNEIQVVFAMVFATNIF